MRLITAIVALLVLTAPSYAGSLQLAANDGTTLSATTWGEGDRGVLLIHGKGRTAEDWASLGPRLASGGFRVLAIDLRGHGASAGPSDYAAMPLDVAAGVEWLSAHGATSLQLVGAALGANLALATAADSRVHGVILLSPQLNAEGHRASAALGAYGERPLFVVASQDEPLSARAAGLLAKSAAGPHQLQLFESAGSGARMLNAEASLEPMLLAWLQANRAPSSPASGPAVRAGEINELQTTGTLLEDRKR